MGGAVGGAVGGALGGAVGGAVCRDALRMAQMVAQCTGCITMWRSVQGCITRWRSGWSSVEACTNSQTSTSHLKFPGATRVPPTTSLARLHFTDHCTESCRPNNPRPVICPPIYIYIYTHIHIYIYIYMYMTLVA